MKYRADIDGLRGIAVLLVLFYHAHFSLISSGFIGVDIFFVISGFLITQIIVSELKTTQTFRLVYFYRKRLWRLMPVLIALLAVTSIIAFLFYLPVDLVNFISSAKSTILFSSNTFFSRISGGYFSPDVSFFLLLHTWSLSIEWQWYAILPLLMWLFCRYIPLRFQLVIMITLCLFFSIYAMYLSQVIPLKNYYRFTARIFELLIGSTLVFLPIERLKLPRWAILMSRSLALLSIGYIALNSQVLNGFPNGYAIIVCLSAAVLIAIGKLDTQNMISRILAFKPLVWIGLISYSLYIWHWPIFTTIRYSSFEDSLVLRIFAIVLSFVVAWFSWYVLERPARRLSQTNICMSLLILFILPLLLIIAMSAAIVANKGFPNRFSAKLDAIDQQLGHYFNKGRSQCINHPEAEDLPVCQLGTVVNPSRTALLIGDSYGSHYSAFMNVLASAVNLGVQSNTKAGCLMLIGLTTQDAICQEYIARAEQRINKKNYDYVILGQRWGGYLSVDDLNNIDIERVTVVQKALDETLSAILATGARPVIFMESFLDLQNGDNLCFYKAIKRRSPMNTMCDVPLSQNTQQKVMEEILLGLTAKYPTLILIDPKIVQCPQGICLSAIDGIPIYEFTSHFNDFGAYRLGENYLKLKGNPFKVDYLKRRSQP